MAECYDHLDAIRVQTEQNTDGPFHNSRHRTRMFQFLVKNLFCQARLEGCTINATDVHHKAGRSKNYLDVLTWLAVCRTCHQWIELNAIAAKEMGLSTSRLQKDDIDCD